MSRLLEAVKSSDLFQPVSKAEAKTRTVSRLQHHRDLDKNSVGMLDNMTKEHDLTGKTVWRFRGSETGNWIHVSPSSLFRIDIMLKSKTVDHIYMYFECYVDGDISGNTKKMVDDLKASVKRYDSVVLGAYKFMKGLSNDGSVRTGATGDSREYFNMMTRYKGAFDV